MSRRIGLIVPSSNTVAEVDFYRRLPDSATLHTARMHLEEVTAEAETTMLDEHLPRAVADIKTTRPEVVVFACTSAGALRGNAAEDDLAASISEQTGVPTVSVAAAVRAAIESRSARRIGVITPYVTSLNDKIQASLEEDGLEVTAIYGMGIVDNHEIGAVQPDRIIRFACDCFEPSSVDLLFVSCTNFRAVEARPRIEELLGLPVVTSNHAGLEAVLHRTASVA